MRSLLLLLPLLFLFVACDEQPQSPKTTQTATVVATDTMTLSDALITHPQVNVSITQPLNFYFRDAVVENDLVGTVLPENPFRFSPPIKGHAKWIQRKKLRFIPEEELRPNTQYSCTIDGNRIYNNPAIAVSPMTIEFQTALQEIAHFSTDFIPVKGKTNRVTFQGTLRFAQAITAAEVQKVISASFNGRKLPLSVTQEKERSVRIKSEELIRTIHAQELSLHLPAKYSHRKKEWIKKVILPEARSFKVLSHSESASGNDKSYTFLMSDEIRQNYNLSGFVKVHPKARFKVKAKGKKLTITGNFKFNTEYMVNIKKGLPSSFGTKMKYDYSATFTPLNLKPQLEFLSEGLFLPTVNDFKVQFKSVNIKKASLRVYEIYPHNIGFFLQSNNLEPRDQKNVFYSLNRVAKTVHNDTIKIDTRKNRWRTTELDLSKYMKGKKGAAFAVQINFDRNCLTGKVVEKKYERTSKTLYYEDDGYYSSPANWGYYYENGEKEKLLFNSDIALTMKTHAGGTTVYATNILTAKPEKGLKLSVYSYLSDIIEEGTTDSTGTITFNSDGVWDKENANYILGKHSSGYALIKCGHSALPTNAFDVSGVVEDAKGTSVFTYADRGVYRPGDTVFLSSIVRINKKLPSKKMSARYSVKNPTGQVIFQKSVKCGAHGHISVAIPTETSAPTGTYSVTIKVGGSTFYHNLKIETVKPNRLKITTSIPDTIRSSEIGGTIETKYLFGTPAAKLKAVGSLTLNSRPFSCSEFPSFTFNSPVHTFSERTVKLFDQKLNTEGQLSFTADLPSKRVIPSLLRGSGTIRVYEKGGSFTKKNFSTTIVPFDAMVGLENPFGWRSAAIGTEYKIPFVSVDMTGNPLENRRVKISVYLNKEHWWWHYDSQKDRDFRKMESTYLIDEKEYISGSDALEHLFEVSDYGQHYIEIEDIESGHSAGFYFWASRWGSAQNPNSKNREQLLKLTLDKKQYTPDDKAIVRFPAPENAIALVSLEQSNRIYSTQWVEAKNGWIECTVPLSRELLPNGYISVSLLQPHKNENDLPIRLFSMIPVHIRDPKTRMGLELKVPKEIRPNDEFEVTLTSAAHNESGSYTIAVVDEGLLSLTNFKTPHPWDHYYKKRGHSVVTRDNYDEFIDALLPDMDKLIAVGGDAESRKEKVKKRVDKNKTQRFKPVVMYSAPLEIKPGETKTTRFRMPNYVGAVRIMVVAAAKQSYTSLEETIPVKQPLMLLTTLPRVVRPRDTIDIPISVFAMDKSVKNVSLSIKTKGKLTLLGKKKTGLTFNTPSEKDHSFRAAVADGIGADTIIVTATSGTEKTSDTTLLPILSASPFYTDVVDTMLSKGEVVELTLEKLGYEGTNSATLQLSRMPDIQLSKRISDLIRYPYGCIEQTTSATLPQIFLEAIAELKPHQKKMATDNVNRGIERLQSFQINNGFSYWPQNRHSSQKTSKWGTLYMGNMLVEAKEAGYHIPPAMFKHWKSSVKSMAASYSGNEYRYKTYAMFLLAYIGEAPIGNMNYLRENGLNRLDPLSVQFLSTAYHLAGQKKVAKTIEENASYEFSSTRELSGTYGSGLRDLSMSAYLATLRGEKALASKLIGQVADRFKPSSWYSTQESAVAVLAIANFYKRFDITGSVSTVTYSINGKEKRITLKKPQYRIDLNEHWGKKLSLSTGGDNPVFVTLMREAVPFVDTIKSAQKGLVLTRKFYSEEGAVISAEKLPQSKPFWILYTVKSKWSSKLDEIALTSMFPSGWEIINLRLTGEKYPSWLGSISEGEYMDIRDDRINWFFDIYSYRTLKFAVKINPSFVGSYKLPAVSAEAMYSPDYYARIASRRCAVVK